MTMRTSRAIAAAAIALTAVTGLAACGGGSSSGGSSANGKVTLTWWNNANTQPLLGVFTNVIKTFEAAHPNITIQNVPMQNEQFKTKITPALRSSSPPDIFQQWGSGQQATQVQSGKLTDISSYVSPWIGKLGVPATEWQTDGKWYGVPYDLHVVGFWYRKDLFAKAGITAPPTSIAELESDDAKLRAKGIAPIAVGSKDGWPDAFWWEYFAVRECPSSDIKQAMSSVNLGASCFTKATADLTAFMKTNPFQTGFAGTPSQVGAGSSAGMVANGKAAMELQGDWDPGVMAGLTSDKSLYSNLGWFPFPAITGAAGDQKAVLGGGDGYSCTTSAAEPACSQFLQYLTTPAVQKQIIDAGAGLPANPAIAGSLAVPAEKQAQAVNSSTDFIAEYFDTALPTTPGQNLDNAIAKFFAAPNSGDGTGIISSVSGPA
jgi:raffinose/stachyose/melibiose transport system substrate-binding protein